MNVGKNMVYAWVLAVLPGIVLSLSFSGVAYPAEDKTFTEADAKNLLSDNPDTAADVLYKLSDIFEAKGKEGLKPAVPALIDAAKKELKLPEDQRWNIVDIIKILSLTGDQRAKPMLLTIMSVMWGGGNPFVAQGLLAIGPPAIPDVVDSLKSASTDTRGRAALTLHKMAQFDESGKFFPQKVKDTIRERLAANLKDTDVNVRIYTVVALRSFGDASVVPALEHIEKYDAHKDSGGTYEVRIEAAETLKVLKGN